MFYDFQVNLIIITISYQLVSFYSFPDMLQLIHNQEFQEFSLFDHTTFPPPPAPTHDLSTLAPSSLALTSHTSSTSSNSSTNLSSSPHLDALLGPPVSHSSSTPEKTFHAPKFQQSTSTKVTSTPVAPSQVKQPKAQTAQPVLHPPSQAPQSPTFTSSPQQPVTNYTNPNGYTGIGASTIIIYI